MIDVNDQRMVKKVETLKEKQDVLLVLLNLLKGNLLIWCY